MNIHNQACIKCHHNHNWYSPSALNPNKTTTETKLFSSNPTGIETLTGNQGKVIRNSHLMRRHSRRDRQRGLAEREREPLARARANIQLKLLRPVRAPPKGLALAFSPRLLLCVVRSERLRPYHGVVKTIALARRGAFRNAGIFAWRVTPRRFPYQLQSWRTCHLLPLPSPWLLLRGRRRRRFLSRTKRSSPLTSAS